jgi:hypothetical protein
MRYHLTKCDALTVINDKNSPKEVLQLNSGLFELLFARNYISQIKTIRTLLLYFSQNIETFEGILCEQHKV